MIIISGEKTGTKLRNGATILAYGGNIVLCQREDEYVTWKVMQDGTAYWGHYFPGLNPESLVKAAQDFLKRVEEK